MHASCIKRLTLFVFLAAFTVCTLAAPARGLAQDRHGDDEVSAPAVVGDLLVVRPLGVVSVIAGSVIFVGTLPFSVWGGSEDVGKVGRVLVAEPAAYTFDRPVGEFQDGPYD